MKTHNKCTPKSPYSLSLILISPFYLHIRMWNMFCLCVGLSFCLSVCLSICLSFAAVDGTSFLISGFANWVHCTIHAAKCNHNNERNFEFIDTSKLHIGHVKKNQLVFYIHSICYAIWYISLELNTKKIQLSGESKLINQVVQKSNSMMSHFHSRPSFTDLK